MRNAMTIHELISKASAEYERITGIQPTLGNKVSIEADVQNGTVTFEPFNIPPVISFQAIKDGKIHFDCNKIRPCVVSTMRLRPDEYYEHVGASISLNKSQQASVIADYPSEADLIAIVKDTTKPLIERWNAMIAYENHMCLEDEENQDEAYMLSELRQFIFDYDQDNTQD